MVVKMAGTYKKSEKIKIQERDTQIFNFLDRIGYANIQQITHMLKNYTEAAILRRLYLLRRFKYLKVFSTHLGYYYALDKLGKVQNCILKSINFDQIENHNFLVELFFSLTEFDVLTERECIAKYKLIGRNGKIPDMIVNDIIIEYKRDNRTPSQSVDLVNYWTIQEQKTLCIICDNDAIKNRYIPHLNPKLRLLLKKDFTQLKYIITSPKAEAVKPVSENNQVTLGRSQRVIDILNKYR